MGNRDMLVSRSEVEALIEQKIKASHQPVTSDERVAAATARERLSKRRYAVFLVFMFIIFNAALAALLTYAYLETREASRFGVFLISALIPGIYAVLVYEGKVSLTLP